MAKEKEVVEKSTKRKTKMSITFDTNVILPSILKLLQADKPISNLALIKCTLTYPNGIKPKEHICYHRSSDYITPVVSSRLKDNTPSSLDLENQEKLNKMQEVPFNSSNQEEFFSDCLKTASYYPDNSQ